MSAIDAQSRITLHFELALGDGSVVDSTFDRKPASFQYGDGSLLPAIEKKLLGMSAGQRQTFELKPEDAFGQRNPANIQRFDRSDFAPGMDLSEGAVLSFADARKAELPGVVQQITDDEVVVDFNHPLAGRTLRFTAEILAVDTPSA